MAKDYVGKKKEYLKSDKPITKETKEQEKYEAKIDMAMPVQGAENMADLFDKLPAETKEKLTSIKKTLDSFKDQLIKELEKYVVGMALLPPEEALKKSGLYDYLYPEQEQVPSEAQLSREKQSEKKSEEKNKKHEDKKINVLILIDDSDSKKGKDELKQKLEGMISGIAKKIDPSLNPYVFILSEVWQSCYDARYEPLQLIAISAPIHDTGWLSAIKLAEVHKHMVLQKFGKYIVSYVLAGSLMQGRATTQSDIDAFVVIDDTDVKRMSRAELKDKLRGIIIGMSFDAKDATNIFRDFHLQVYTLTDFWDSIREANPIIFTFLRDGVPFYDRGVFMPWKQLLKMGKIKPSPESIDQHMSIGESILTKIDSNLRSIAMEDLFYAVITPSQAALMLYGLPPATHREAAELMREFFVKKEKYLSDNDVKFVERIFKLHKDIEHDEKKTVTGKELDELLVDAKKYLQKLRTLFDTLQESKDKESIVSIYDILITSLRDALSLEGMKEVSEENLLKEFKSKIVDKNKASANLLRSAELIFSAKKDYEKGKLTRPEVEKARNTASQFFKDITEYMQRNKLYALERSKIRVVYQKDKIGEIIFMKNRLLIRHDVTNPEVHKASYKQENGIAKVGEHISIYEDEFEKELLSGEFSAVEIDEQIFDLVKKVFGKDAKIVIK